MTWDPVWEEIYRNRSWGRYPGEDLIRFIARNFHNTSDRGVVKILEVGCGPGPNLWYLAREGFTVYGIDGSPSAIHQAKLRLEECVGWHGQVVVGDIKALPFPDDMFDVVIDIEAVCCNTFEHAIEIYDEMARVTKPGGRFFARTFATGTWGEGTGEPLGYQAYRVEEGPLAGIGCCRFSTFDDLPKLMRSFHLTEIEEMVRTVGNREHAIKEWVVIGEKK